MKIDSKKVIKTKPKMIKESYGIADLFATAVGIGALIQLVIQLDLYINEK